MIIYESEITKYANPDAM